MAESFGANAERYDRARPRYPDALIDRIVSSSPGPDILDVGIGTGIVARQLRDRGCQVLGVDVDPRMASVARSHGFVVEVVRFEDWDAGDRRFDAIASGQTWHWIDPIAGPVKAASLLKEGGRLVLFWNVGQPPADLAQRFAAVHSRVLPGSAFNPWTVPALQAYNGFQVKAADSIRANGSYEGPEQWQFPWERAYTRDEWLDQMRTAGTAGQIPPDTFDMLLSGIGDAVDAVGGHFTMAYTAVAVTAVRRA